MDCKVDLGVLGVSLIDDAPRSGARGPIPFPSRIKGCPSRLHFHMATNSPFPPYHAICLANVRKASFSNIIQCYIFL